MATGQGTAIIDFGAAPGANEASVAVTGQSAILGTSKAEAYVMADDTSTDHTASDHRYFAAFAGLSCGTPSPVGVTDSFNRADSATTMGTSDSGHLWVPNSGVWGISANEAYRISGTDATTVVESLVADCTITVTINIGGITGLCWRSTDNNNYFQFAAGAYGTVYKKEAGGYTQMGDGGGWTPGDILTVVLAGNSTTIKKNGVEEYSYTSSFNQTATKHGLYSDYSPGRFNDFSVATGIAGGGFTIYGRSLEQLEGKYTVRYVWSD